MRKHEYCQKKYLKVRDERQISEMHSLISLVRLHTHHILRD